MKRRKQYIICFIISLLILLNGCSLLMDREDPFLKYKGEQYSLVQNWQMINADDYSIDKATWEGKEYKVFVFSDPQKRFIFDEYYQLLYHKQAELLPNFKDINRIEKIEIVFSDVNKNKTILNDKSIIGTVVKLMSQPYNRDSFINNSTVMLTVAAINVYFNDYPAYQTAVSVVKAKDGSYGFVMTDWNETEDVCNCAYIAIPLNSSIRSFFE